MIDVLLSRTLRFCVQAMLIFVASIPLVVCAGFLEMPDTTEAQEVERKSMLNDMDIPPVRDRDPDPMSGPRLNVSEFRVQGIVEYPELGITRKSLMKLVEGIRFDMMSEGEMLESGYTLDEVSEISDMIALIEEETEGQHVTPLDVQRLVFLIREQRQRRGVTLGMIEAVADTITRYYRERGFILAKAYIPKQRVRDGVVTLTLLLGRLGEVNVINNEKYSDRTIQKIFQKDLNQPVKSSEIEEKLFFVNDLPGLSAQAYFEPGSQVGDTKLSINVLGEQKTASNIRIDNHGSKNTGRHRLYADAYLFNPFGLGDQLHVGLLTTLDFINSSANKNSSQDRSNSLYGSLHYGLPLFLQRGKWSFGGSTNDFVSRSIEGITVSGTSHIIDTSLNYIIKRSRVSNYSVELRASHISTDLDDLESLTLDALRDSKIQTIDFLGNFDVLLGDYKALHQGGIRLSSVKILEGGQDHQDSESLILAAQYSLLKFVRLPFSSTQSRLTIKFAGQYTEDTLNSVNHFSLAGPNKVRALPINHYNSDTGVYTAVDWVFNGPKFLSMKIGGERLGDILQPYVFYEFAYGDAYGDGGAAAIPGTWAGVTDLGFGFKVISRQGLRLNLSYARVMNYLEDNGRKLLKEQGLEDMFSVYFDMQYSF